MVAEYTETARLLSDTEANNLERADRKNSIPSYGTMINERRVFKKDPDSDTTCKSELKLLLKNSAPLVATYLLQYSYNLVTVFVAGRLGTNELGAASLASMTANITGLAVYEGMASSLDTLTSQAYGNGQKKMVGLYVQRMIALILVATIPIAALWISSPWILVRIVPEKELGVLAGQFMRIYLIGAPGFGIFEAGKRFTQAQGIFTASLVAALVCAPLNLLWNWLFVFRLGFGYQGAAMAVALSNTLQPIVLLIYIKFFARHTLQCWPGLSIKGAFRNWGPMVKLAIPGIAMTLSEWLAFDILTFSASYISAAHLASQSVLITVCITMFHISMPIAVAASTRFGNLIGRGALPAARSVFKYYYLTFICIGLFNLTLLASLRYPIAFAFSSEPVVRKIIVAALPVVAVQQMVDTAAILSNALLRGLGRQKIGGWVNLGAYYPIGIPLSLFLAFGPPKLAVTGLWIGPCVCLGIVTCTLFCYMRWTDWQKSVDAARDRCE